MTGLTFSVLGLGCAMSGEGEKGRVRVMGGDERTAVARDQDYRPDDVHTQRRKERAGRQRWENKGGSSGARRRRGRLLPTLSNEGARRLASAKRSIPSP